MRSSHRILLCCAALAVGLFGARVETSPPGSEREAASLLVGFGGTVVVGDSEVFAGEPANQFRPGTVYVYRKSAGSWLEVATLTAPTATVGDGFGSALALDGERLFVGAGAGAVHVFTKQGTSWTFGSTVAAADVPLPPAPAAGATTTDAAQANTSGAAPIAQAPAAVRFGNAIGVSGDWLLIGKELPTAGRGRGGAFGGGGARGDAPTVQPPGSVFAFKRDATGRYAYYSTLMSADASTRAGDYFGSALAVAGNVAIIGASGEARRAGVVHEFGLGADGTWTSQRTFAPVGVQGNELFGAAIALGGDQAIVAAPGDAGGYGAVYVFRKVTQGRGRGAFAAAGQAASATQGAAAAGQAAPATQGAAAGGNIVWQETARLAAPAGGRSDRFASALAADDREVWVGAPGAGGPGRVFLFPWSASGFQIDGLKLLGPSWTDPVSAGVSISVRGNVAAVGAVGVNRGAGGLFIYERDAFGAWREQPMITTPLDELPAFTGSERRCTGSGKVEMFDCGAADLLSFLPPSKLSHDGHYIPISSIWGWTDPQTKQEWALLGRRDGTAFVDITNPTRPLAVADLPLTEGARPSAWREIKVYKDHAFIVSDGAGPHGVQIFDLTRLRTMKPQPNGLPQKVQFDAIYRNVNSVHNIVINEDSGFMYPVGSSGGGTTCGGGLHIVDIREPKNPKFIGCYADTGSGRAGTGYSHDALCVTYKGPDKRYKGHEICVGSNETAISLADVTDKTSPRFLARAAYPNVGYTHQGWFDEAQRYFYVNDEGDEVSGTVKKTRTLIWDLVDLENPRLAKEHLGVNEASDHNLYIKGDLMYQANYRSGLRVLTIRDPVNPKEIAYFDTAPYHSNTPGFNGAWSVYPFFKSGTIIVSSIEQGLFIVKTADR